MALTPEHNDAILAAIKQKMGSRTMICPISGDNKWGVEPHLVFTPVSDNPQMIQIGGGPSLPLAVMTCQTCGYTVYLNVFKLGIAGLFGLEEATGA